ncbi:site-specific DNA-methyltransferase [Ancylothrix sp. C2]|uniref:site-specific DNA-methyltransferase n=1 Tax=Ancylothrix sp. D3o TaxID=2953691 RepID=UPI0021BABE1B|nr:site-specific DNA-methyltransferase [Ancylothrix sp. D3o]MCT7949195.1 site-specific DNA-methyltransferase [Ancylothrix sp. D3o]
MMYYDLLKNKYMIVKEEQTFPPSQKRHALYDKFQAKISANSHLTRSLVSFQANKQRRFSGWFKYKEGFSEQLVNYLLEKLKPQPGILLDPFAGTGTALFAANALGWQTQGIELLPVGVYSIQARQIAQNINIAAFKTAVAEIIPLNFTDYYDEKYSLQHIPITQGAFAPAEEKQLTGYLAYCQKYVENSDIRTLLLYAAFCILEDISYTRKDGQYLRWDYRAGRSQAKKQFTKPEIYPFKIAIQRKLTQITQDLQPDNFQQLSLFTPLFEIESNHIKTKEPVLYQGSCLEILPTMPAQSIDFVLTSPPYANRYDYTRTYALELVFLGCKEEKVKQLRQAMLSCTVENKDKQDYLKQIYTNQARLQDFLKIESTFEKQEALQEVLEVLELYRQQGKLNNSNITRMLRNYFYEMSFVIYELARLIKPGGIIAMVNDNVQYAGEEVPVDLILCDIAESFGLSVRHIWTLERGKGNSSQQMGNHGRSEIRKSVYIWEK